MTSKQVVVLGMAHYLPNKNSRIPIYLRVGLCGGFLAVERSGAAIIG